MQIIRDQSKESTGVAQELTAQAEELHQIVKKLANLAGFSSTKKNIINAVDKKYLIKNADQIVDEKNY